MQRLFRIFAGPELYWVLLYLGVRWLAARNVPPNAPGNTALEWAVWLTATIGVARNAKLNATPIVAVSHTGCESMDIMGTTRHRGVRWRECLRDRRL